MAVLRAEIKDKNGAQVECWCYQILNNFSMNISSNFVNMEKTAPNNRL